VASGAPKTKDYPWSGAGAVLRGAVTVLLEPILPPDKRFFFLAQVTLEKKLSVFLKAGRLKHFG